MPFSSTFFCLNRMFVKTTKFGYHLFIAQVTLDANVVFAVPRGPTRSQNAPGEIMASNCSRCSEVGISSLICLNQSLPSSAHASCASLYENHHSSTQARSTRLY